MNLSGLSDLLIGLGSPHDFFVQRIADSVFHYTDLDALRGIVSSQDLWLTDSRYSNDSEEMEHGFTVAERAIERLLRRSDTDAAMLPFLGEVKARLKKARDYGVYVCCFCLADDLLGQWRSYGANGMGVSLRLATREFEFVSGPDLQPATFGLVYLWRVFYELDQQKQLIEDCLNRTWNRLESPDEKVDLAVEAIRFFIPTFKNRAFEAEQEARLVFNPVEKCPVKPSFRVARGMLVPYYSLRALVAAAKRGNWRLPLESVRVGPSALREENRRSVALFLRGADYPQATVEVSKTPYRG